jgi:hypothetical protein
MIMGKVLFTDYKMMKKSGLAKILRQPHNTMAQVYYAFTLTPIV